MCKFPRPFTFSINLILVLTFLIAAMSTYVFANANTITESNLGFKASPVTGYAITNVEYDLDDATPSLLVAITFDLSPIAPNDRPPLLVNISTARTAAVVADPTANPPISAIAAAPANWLQWTCGITGASPTWSANCTPSAPVDAGVVYSLDIVASSSLNVAD